MPATSKRDKIIFTAMDDGLGSICRSCFRALEAIIPPPLSPIASPATHNPCIFTLGFMGGNRGRVVFLGRSRL
ncbi:hypothetical protein J6590_041912 [Homalodisca vitripennis]|nr:hypothetical protein J6590_041912 [Homalodisca vitripennis]